MSNVLKISSKLTLVPHVGPFFMSQRLGNQVGSNLCLSNDRRKGKVDKDEGLNFFVMARRFCLPIFCLSCFVLDSKLSLAKILTPHLTCMFAPFSCHGDSCLNLLYFLLNMLKRKMHIQNITDQSPGRWHSTLLGCP